MVLYTEDHLPAGCGYVKGLKESFAPNEISLIHEFVICLMKKQPAGETLCFRCGIQVCSARLS